MKKRLVLLIFLIILFIEYVNASIDVTYNTNPNTGVVYEGYKCIDNCDNINNLQFFLTKTGSGTTILVSYPEEASYNNYFYKDCFYPFQSKTSITQLFNGQIINYNLLKKPACQASISSVNIVGDQKVGSTLTISTTVQSPFQKGTNAPYNFVPSARVDYYKADTKIDLLVDDNVKQTVTKNLLIDTSETVEFTWTPSSSESGNHKIKIKSNVIDCQCQQPQSDVISSESSVNIQSQPSTPSCLDECTTNQKQCNQTNTKLLQTCKLGTNGCNYWQNTDCSINNQVCFNSNCVTPSVACTENWICGYPYYNSANQWSACINSIQSKICNDTNNCGTTNTKPTLTQSCSTAQDTTEQPQVCVGEDVCSSWSECIEGKKTRQCVNSCAVEEKIESKDCDQEIIEIEKSAPQADINQAIGNITTNFFNTLANKLEEILKTSKYSLIILFMLVASIIVSIVYYIETHREKILKPKQKVKDGKKPVKINDLMLSVIDSLDTDEREICYALAENEGITQDEIRNKVNLTKTKLEIALTKLERRQVIKPREGENPKLYFNDWLK